MKKRKYRNHGEGLKRTTVIFSEHEIDVIDRIKDHLSYKNKHMIPTTSLIVAMAIQVLDREFDWNE